MGDVAYLLSLSLSQIKAIRKAIHTLVRAGMFQDDAVRLIIQMHQQNGRLRKAS